MSEHEHDHILLEVDAREPESLKNLLRDQGINHVVKELPAGDFILRRIKDNRIIYVIERKSNSDFYSSIKSGHYQTQRNNLLSFIADSTTTYNYVFDPLLLLEGYTKKNSRGENVLSASGGCLENLILRYKINILPTVDLEHTVDTLISLKKKLESAVSPQDPQLLADRIIEYHDSAQKGPVTIPTDTQIFKKKGTVVSKTLFAHQLTAITGVSLDKAKCITAVYPCAAKLVDAFHDNKSALVSLQFRDNKKIGKSINDKVYNNMMGV